MERRMTFTQIMWLFSLVVLLVTIAYPLFMLIYKSLFGEKGFGYAYKVIVSDPNTWVYAFNTVKLAVIVTFFAILIGVPLAFFVVRTDLPGRKIVRFLAVLPFILPPYVSAIAWIQLAAPYVGYINRIWKALGHSGNLINIYSFAGLVLVMTLKFYVYVFLTVAAALEQMDPSLEEAARMSGAHPFKVARDVTIPLVMPSIASGALLAFVATCANFGIPALIGDRAHYYVLTTRIYSTLSIPDLDKATAYSILLVILTGVALLIQKKSFGEKRYTTLTGKTVRPSVIALGKHKGLIALFVFIFLALTSVIPLFSLFFSAFLKNLYSPLTSLSSFTIDNFKFVLIQDETTTTALRTSIFSALLASTIVTLFGALLAYMIVKTNVKGRLFMDWLSSVPYALPGTVVGVAIILAFIKTPIFNTLWIIPFAYFVRYLSYGVRTTVGSLLQIDKTLEEASLMCGANWLTTMKNIVLPLIKPGLIAAWILVFMPTLSELTVSIIIYPPNHPTIGVATYNLMEEGQYTAAYALSAVVAVVVILAQLVVNRITGKMGARGL
ncbi:MAG: iron ABC transporter permease [Thermococcus sp.]|uniref:ABC transporter permease n=1 Tax=Thermococcus sp. TaxID=35749 RepID=UPI001D7CA620|nr:iron ABC transporter permease [Thermococcus sp.]MBO8173819.1 iron ABC transporter permease [Thermococcus sp.]